MSKYQDLHEEDRTINGFAFRGTVLNGHWSFEVYDPEGDDSSWMSVGAYEKWTDDEDPDEGFQDAYEDLVKYLEAKGKKIEGLLNGALTAS